MNGAAQIGHHRWPHQLQKIERGRAGSVFEKKVGAAPKLLHAYLAVDYHRGGCIGTKHNTIGNLLKLRGGRAIAGEPPGIGMSGFEPPIGNKIDMVRRSHIFLRVNFVPFVH